MLTPEPILLPVVALVLWSLVMQVWMLASRIPAMNAAQLDPQAGVRTAELAGKLPGKVQWKADNYNHLMEQPTLFYAMALALAVAGSGTELNLWLAWIYTGSRVVHSLIQATVNRVPLRFSVFVIGTLALAVMAVNGAMQLL